MKHVISIFAILSVVAFKSFSQNKVITEMKTFKMCKINSSGSEYDCKENVGKLIYDKIEIIPNKTVTVFPKNSSESSKISIPWNDSRISMNNDKDLYICDFLSTDITKPNGSIISIIIRLDYSVQQVIYFLNYEGQINKFTMFGK